MNIENEDLTKIVDPEDSKLKNLIVEYVGEKTNPENDEVTVHNIIEVFAEEFPEFMLVLAEENWISGYTQALSDVEYLTPKIGEKNNEPTRLENIHEE